MFLVATAFATCPDFSTPEEAHVWVAPLVSPGDPTEAAEALWDEVAGASCVTTTTDTDRSPDTGYYWSDHTTDTSLSESTAACTASADGFDASGTVRLDSAASFDDFGSYSFNASTDTETWDAVFVAFDAASGRDPWAARLDQTITDVWGSGDCCISEDIDRSSEGELWNADGTTTLFSVTYGTSYTSAPLPEGGENGSSVSWTVDACTLDVTAEESEVDYGWLRSWSLRGPSHTVDVTNAGCGMLFTEAYLYLLASVDGGDLVPIDSATWAPLTGDADGDGWTTAIGDCDDTDATTHPCSVTSEADGVDHDCSDFVPPPDTDGDGTVDAEDCRPSDDRVHPGAVETCDGVDEDCDGVADDDAVDASAIYTDADGDGYGLDSSVTEGCRWGDGLVLEGGDCDDADPEVSPGAEDVCADGEDQDCDGADAACDSGETGEAREEEERRPKEEERGCASGGARLSFGWVMLLVVGGVLGRRHASR